MAKVVLRAINNRKYIYAVTLKFEYDKLKEMNTQNALEEGAFSILVNTCLKSTTKTVDWLYSSDFIIDFEQVFS